MVELLKSSKFYQMKQKNMIYLCLEIILSSCTDKTVCISKAEKASAEREHIAKDDKLALILNGVDGLLVEVDNPRDTAEKVLWLYHHPKEATKMKNKALKKVIENYDIKSVEDLCMKMFINLIAGGLKNKVLFIDYTTLYSEERRVAA